MATRKLQSEIWNLRCENADNRHFVPLGQLHTTFNAENVRTTLDESGVEFQELARTADFILHRAQRIFAILLSIHEVGSILDFIGNDQLQLQSLDQCLPFRKGALDFLSPETAARFYEAQWEFAAPIFSHQFHHRALDPSTTMPFISSTHIGKGSVGDVHELELHPQHHELHYLRKDGKVKIVRKEIAQPPEGRSINDEQRVLSILNGLKHPNILELLGSYTLQGKHNLLFPLAPRTLSSYLSSKDQMLGFADYVSILLAFPGLVSALQALHSYIWESVSLIGCHHDIKPDNVLIMDNRFVLADFGLSTFKDPSKGSETFFRSGQGFYFAPEYEDYKNDFQKHPIRRKSDIWSLGCVLLELLVFIALGAEGVENFRHDRRVTFGGYFTIATFHHGRDPNQGVQQYLAKLHGTAPDEGRSDLIALISEMLSIEPEKRPSALQALRRLRCLALKHIFREIQDDYDDLDNASLPFDFLLEKEKFKCWNKAFRAALNPEVNFVPQVLENDPVYNSVVDSALEIRSTLSSTQEKTYNIHFNVTKLRQINDDLAGTLDSLTQNNVLKEVELSILNSDCNDMPRFSVHVLEEISVSRRLGLLAALRHMHSLSQTPPNESSERWRINKDSLYNEDRNRFKEFDLARHSDKSEVQDVLIQWMVYDEKWAGDIGKVLFARVEAIVEFLRAASQSPSFRILNCLGYYHEPKRHAFGVVFTYPDSDTKCRMTPTTLHRLIQNTKNVRKRPELGQLFRLAQSLASSLLEYHTISWLHKNVSSHHIVFFGTGQDSSTYDISLPYVIGFDHSRLDRPNEYSEGLWDEQNRMKYQHPLYRSGQYRFRPEFDYFSLGLVFLEIGLWKPLEGIPETLLRPQEDYQNYMTRIQREVLPLLGPRMGKAYRDATSACLTFNISSNTMETAHSAAQSVSTFKDSVVGALSGCSV